MGGTQHGMAGTTGSSATDETEGSKVRPMTMTRRRVKPNDFLRSLWTRPHASILLDVLASFGAFFAAFWLRATLPMPATQDLLSLEVLSHLKPYALAFGGVQVFLFVSLRLHIFHRNESRRDIFTKITAAVVIQCLMLAGVLYVLRVHSYPASVIVVYAFLDVIFCVLWRLIRHGVIRRGPSRLIMVGLAEQLVVLRSKALEGGWAKRDDQIETVLLGPRMGDQLVELIRRQPSSEVLIATDGLSDEVWVEVLSTVEERVEQVYVTLATSVAMLGGHRIRMLADTPVLEAQSPLTDPVRRSIKKTVDFVGALFLLVLAMPVLGLVGALIWLQDRGPVFYVQTRLGLRGLTFRILKFRTMCPDAEHETGPVLSHERDPRITRLGRILRKLRLDELPQLLNVLKGDMSLVGPRPERPERIEVFERTVPMYHLRHKVRPGLTGLAQVWGRYDTTPADKLKLDLYYVYNNSLLLDYKILLQTLWVAVSRLGT